MGGVGFLNDFSKSGLSLRERSEQIPLPPDYLPKKPGRLSERETSRTWQPPALFCQGPLLSEPTSSLILITPVLSLLWIPLNFTAIPDLVYTPKKIAQFPKVAWKPTGAGWIPGGIHQGSETAGALWSWRILYLPMCTGCVTAKSVSSFERVLLPSHTFFSALRRCSSSTVPSRWEERALEDALRKSLPICPFQGGSREIYGRGIDGAAG